MKKVLYECDPRKNTECRKTSCFKYNGPCRRTAHPEYAVRDENGEPVIEGELEVRRDG